MISLENKSDCCGCTACASVCPANCISMSEDLEGFLYPHVDREKCIGCGLCEKACIFSNRKKLDELSTKWHPSGYYVVQAKIENEK